MSIKVLKSEITDGKRYDLLICAVGYEKRSRYILERFHKKADICVGYFFGDGHILSFEKNQRTFDKLGGLRINRSTSIESVISEHRPEKICKDASILLDVSSLNRAAMSHILNELIRSAFFSRSRIDIAYSVSKYKRPSRVELDFLDFNPLENFEGWTANPERPTTLLLGLGYEVDHAVGAIEYLDPSAAYCFFPVGTDSRFDRDVKIANAGLIEMLSDRRLVKYPIVEPYDTYWLLRTLILSVIDLSRIVLVPMGPKVFCSLCLVCQAEFGNEISVWRASGHTLEHARDADAEGAVVGYRVERLS